MTFLNPLILTGLFAISIPILIHLLNLSKVRKVEFSTLRFLKELQKSKMKRIRLRQLLLLALRVMTIVFLVLAFADPVLESSTGGYGGKSSAFVLLDNSYSMSAKDGSIFGNAKTAAKEIVSNLDNDDDIFFLLSSDLGKRSASLTSADKQSILARIDSAEISLKPLNMEEALTASALAFANSSFAVKDLFIISDMQSISFPERLFNERDYFGFPVSVFAIGSGDEELNNMSLDSSEILSSVAFGGIDTELRIKLNNISQYSQNSAAVRTTVNGNYSSEDFADVGSFSSKVIDVRTRLLGTEHSRIEFSLDRKSIEDDQLTYDNKNYLSVTPPARIRALLSGDDQEQGTYLRLALQTVLGGTEESQDYFTLEEGEISESSLAGKDAVIIYDVSDLTADEYEALRRYAEGGGGILIFPGNNLNTESLNEKLLSLSGGMRIIGEQNTGSESPLSFGMVDFDHPVLRGIFRNKQLSATSDASSIESPGVVRHYRSVISENARPVIMLETGDPFMTELELGEGRIIFFSVSLGNDMSDLPRKSIFVPLVVRSVNYLSGSLTDEDIHYVGSENLVRVKGIENIISISDPSGKIDTTNYSFSEGKENFMNLPYSSSTSLAGFYTAYDSSGSQFVFALNPNPVESDLSILSGEEVEKYFNDRGLQRTIYADWDDADTVYESSGKGRQLWKYFIVLALLALAAEKILSRRLEKGN